MQVTLWSNLNSRCTIHQSTGSIGLDGPCSHPRVAMQYHVIFSNARYWTFHTAVVLLTFFFSLIASPDEKNAAACPEVAILLLCFLFQRYTRSRDQKAAQELNRLQQTDQFWSSAGWNMVKHCMWTLWHSNGLLWEPKRNLKAKPFLIYKLIITNYFFLEIILSIFDTSIRNYIMFQADKYSSFNQVLAGNLGELQHPTLGAKQVSRQPLHAEA